MKESARYVKIVEWSDEDHCYVGSAPGLVYGGCHGSDERALSTKTRGGGLAPSAAEQINEAHPAYRRAVASRAEGYHVALTVAMALAPLAVEPAKEHGFVTTFLAVGRSDRAPNERRRR